RY
ncbi:sugar (and other) transporter family protein, partial [Vibrio parahaemolyticus V-223/04]